MSVKFLSAILGPEMAAPILWAPGKMRSFCRKTMSIKFLLLGFFFWGGGSADFIFMGARIFLTKLPEILYFWPFSCILMAKDAPNIKEFEGSGVPQRGAGRGASHEIIWDAAFLLTVGSFLLTVEIFYLQLTILAFLLTVAAFLLTVLASLLAVGAFLLTVGKCN